MQNAQVASTLAHARVSALYIKLELALGKSFAAILIVLFAVSFLQAQSKTNEAAHLRIRSIKTQDSADPWMFFHNGFYYLTATFDAG